MNHSQRDLLRALLDDLEQIDDNADLFEEGRVSAYQSVAVQLRNLLVNKDRLLPELIPDATLHELEAERTDQLASKGGVLLAATPRGVTMTISTGGPSSGVLRVTDRTLPLDEWLDQVIVYPNFRIRQLIHEIASSEVAHTGEKIGGATSAANQLSIRSSGSARDPELHQLIIVAIGRYIAERIRVLSLKAELLPRAGARAAGSRGRWRRGRLR